MTFDIVTLFPDMISTVLGTSITGRAAAKGAVTITAHNFRAYTHDRHNRVDDTPYGGGKGMLLTVPPIYECCEAVMKMRSGKRIRRIYMSPQGRTFDQAAAKRLAGYDGLLLICGHYEGVDQRVIDLCADEELSIGDFVLTGGEIPACIVCDAVSRLVPGVLADEECFRSETFEDGLFEYPQYTRPEEFMGIRIPDVLLTGHHAKINDWRHGEAVKKTEAVRPDLLGERKE